MSKLVNSGSLRGQKQDLIAAKQKNIQELQQSKIWIKVLKNGISDCINIKEGIFRLLSKIVSRP